MRKGSQLEPAILAALSGGPLRIREIVERVDADETQVWTEVWLMLDRGDLSATQDWKIQRSAS